MAPKIDKPTIEDQGKDFDKQQNSLSVEDEQQKMFAFMAKYTTNSVSIAGKITEKYKGEPKPKMSKDENGKWVLPVYDEQGQQVFKAPYLSVTLAFEGGSIQIKLDADKWDNCHEGKRYLFDGFFGIEYGEVQPKFPFMTLLA